jgi:nucleoside-diphosphate kinase
VTERTFVMVKPDGVQRGLVGEVLGRYEDRGLKVAALAVRDLDRATAEEHYAEHEDRPFFDDLCDYITSSPVICAVVEGPDAIEAVREVNGATDPLEANPGTIRGDYAIDVGRNVVHGADSPRSAKREIGIHFDEAEITSYDRVDDPWLTE